MKNLIFIGLLSLSFAACIGKNQQPLPPDAQYIQPEALGTPNSEQQGGAFTISTAAFYQASINSASSPGRVISLSLNPKRQAEMTTDFLDQSQVLVDTGVWTTLDNGNLQLNLRRKGAKDSIVLEFQTDGEKLIYKGDEYGTAGLVLWVKPLPE